MLPKLLRQLDSILTLRRLSKGALLLLILYFLSETADMWNEWFLILKAILQPFILGFILAFIIHPLILWLEKKGIHKNISIFVFWILLIIFVVLLSLIILPLLYDKISGFISNLIIGVEWISRKIVNISEFENFDLVNQVTNYIINFLNSYENWLPGIVSTLPGFANIFMNIITNTLFTVIITIYMLFDFPKIKRYINKFCSVFYADAPKYLDQIDEDVTIYTKSLFILMGIKFVEYCLFYYLIGHEDWIIIGLLTSIGLLIPYLGGTIANVIGILTALTLSPLRIFFLLVGICILSNLDAYVISPFVHEKRSDLGPLVTLLAVFAGGVLYGAIGIMFSIPVAIALKAIRDVYENEEKAMQENQNK